MLDALFACIAPYRVDECYVRVVSSLGNHRVYCTTLESERERGSSLDCMYIEYVCYLIVSTLIVSTEGAPKGFSATNTVPVHSGKNIATI